MSAHLNGGEMSLGVPQKRRVKGIAKHKVGPTEHCLRLFKEKVEGYARHRKCIHGLTLGSCKRLVSLYANRRSLWPNK